MALVAERWGLIPELRQFAAQQRPIWGTCAGLIFLADRASGGLSRWPARRTGGGGGRSRQPLRAGLAQEHAAAVWSLRAACCFRVGPSLPPASQPTPQAVPRHLAAPAAGMKEGGQALLGGLDCTVQRNFFGAQINSFETQLPAPACLPRSADPSETFRALFIRAPAITETGPGAACCAVPCCAELCCAASCCAAWWPVACGALGRQPLAPAGMPLFCCGRPLCACLACGASSLAPWCLPLPLWSAGVEVLAEYCLSEGERAQQQRDSVAVAVRSGPLMATAFHPELTQARRCGDGAGTVDLPAGWQGGTSRAGRCMPKLAQVAAP